MELTNLNRREVVIGAGAVATLGFLPFSGAANAAGVPNQLRMGFDIVKDGKSKIGEHVVSFKLGAGNKLQIDSQADVLVKVAGVTAVQYNIRLRELWHEERLLAMTSKVSNKGKVTKVDARAQGNQIAVSGPAGKFAAPASAVPASFWSIASVKRQALIDVREGKLLNVSTRAVGRNKLKVSSQPIAATRFDTSGDLDMSLWYSDSSEWVALSTKIKGAQVTYRRTI